MSVRTAILEFVIMFCLLTWYEFNALS